VCVWGGGSSSKAGGDLVANLREGYSRGCSRRNHRKGGGETWWQICEKSAAVTSFPAADTSVAGRRLAPASAPWREERNGSTIKTFNCYSDQTRGGEGDGTEGVDRLPLVATTLVI